MTPPQARKDIDCFDRPVHDLKRHEATEDAERHQPVHHEIEEDALRPVICASRMAIVG